MQLIALAFDSSVAVTFKPQGQLSESNIFETFARSAEGITKSQPFHLNVARVIEVMLIGRNKKALRVAAAHAVKALYDCEASRDLQIQIRDSLLQQLPLLRTKGVNSLELVAVLSYFVNKEVESKGLGADEALYKRITRELYKQILRTNQ